MRRHRSTRRLCILLLILWGCFAPFAASPVVAGDWNQWRGAQRDGVDHTSPPLLSQLPETGLKPVWIRDDLPAARSGGWASPVIAEGRVFLFSHNRNALSPDKLPPPKYPYIPREDRGKMSEAEYEKYEELRREEERQRSKSFRFEEILHCLDVANGKEVWQAAIPSSHTRFPQSGSPAVIGGKAYVLGAGGKARCYDIRDGKVLWETQLPIEVKDEFFQSSFTVADGVATVLARRLFGLDAASGKILWENDLDSGELHASPAVWKSNGKEWIIANAGKGQTLCLEPRSGKVVWSVASEAGHATPVIVGDKLLTYGNSRKKGLRCYQLKPIAAHASLDSITPPEIKWNCQSVADQGSSPTVFGGRVFVQGEQRLFCLNLETGEEDWGAELEIPRTRYASLAAADGKIFYVFDAVLWFAADPKEYRPIFQGRISTEGVLASEAAFRKQLDLDRLEQSAEGQKQAEQLWRKLLGDSGPLQCSSPSLADGRLYLRLKKGLVCYDLRAQK